MNVVNKLTLRHLLLNKKRTLVTIIGVILSVSMVTAVTTFVASAQDMLIQDTINDRGNWHAKFQDIDAAKADVFLESEAVEQALFARNLGYAELMGSANEYKPYMFIQEFDKASIAELALELVDGRLPKQENEVVVSEHIRYNGGVEIKVGDKLDLAIGQRYSDGYPLGQDNPFSKADADGDGETLQPEFTREFTVVGIVARPWFEPYSAPGYTVITCFDRNSATTGPLDVRVRFKKINRSVYELGQELAAQAESPDYIEEDSGVFYLVRYNDTLLALYGVTGSEVFSNILTTFALIAIAIIMIGSISLIYNAFAISISERSRQLGMLASVGATSKQKRRSVFFEGLIIGLAGIPLGVLAGTVGMGITFSFVGPILANLVQSSAQLRLIVSPLAIVIAILFSMLTIFISAWIPARRAAKIAPIAAIRQSRDVKLTRRAVRTSWLTRLLFGFEATLALKNLKRNRSRFRATVVSLTVSIVLFLTVSAYATYVTVGSNMYTPGLNCDMEIAQRGMSKEERDFFAQVISLKQVEEYSYEQSCYGYMQVPAEMASDFLINKWGDPKEEYNYYIMLKSLDEKAFADLARAAGVGMDAFTSGKPAAIALNQFRMPWQGGYVESEVIKAPAGTELTVDLSSSFGERDQEISFIQEITLAGVTTEAPMGSSVWTDPLSLTLFVPETMFDQLLAGLPDEEQRYTGTLYINTSEPGLLEEKIRSMHQCDAGDFHIYNQAQAAQEEKQSKLLLTVFITGFILLITGICIANIINTITTSIALRRREFAMLKSVGMTPKGFNRMIRYESVFYGIKALSFGLPISLGINYLLYRAMSDGFQFPFTLPWNSYIVAVVSVFAIVFITMLYSSLKMKNENIIDSLKNWSA
jgi:putative ABC transport system permease protein